MMRCFFCVLAVSFAFGSAFETSAQNYKIKQTTSMNGQKMESTVYVRGVRKRTEGGAMMGFGGDVATVEQCDLKQTLKVNDKKKQYAIEPFDSGSAGETAVKGPAARPGKPAPATRGGTVTYVSSITDTGERKTLFGMTARRVKTSMSVEASPDACSPQGMKSETDGWYIDLPEFSCPLTYKPQMPPADERGGGCQDKVAYRNTGTGKLGFPLEETRSISMGGDMTFTQMLQTVEFSKATLEASLFDVPQGYAKVGNAQELYGQPDFSAIARQAMADNENNDTVSATRSANAAAASRQIDPSAKKPGVVRIGVLPPTNRGDAVSTNLQAYLVQRLTNATTEAISVMSESDAKAANCDYTLSSDISKLKQSTAGKIGGVFGKVTNTGVSGSYDAQVDFKLVSLATGQVKLQSKGAAKTENDVDRAAEGVFAQEAAAVIAAVGRN